MGNKVIGETYEAYKYQVNSGYIFNDFFMQSLYAKRIFL
jgi:hypothetical protein